MPTQAKADRPSSPGQKLPVRRGPSVTAGEAPPVALKEPNQEEFSDRHNDREFRHFAESIVQHIDEVFFWRDPDNLKPYFVSHAYERIWGQSCHSVYAEPSSWTESIHPNDRERVTQESQRAATAPQTQVEYRIVRPDGDVRWVWARTFLVESQDGTAKRLIGIAQDVTERKQAEKMRAFLASIVESSDDSIIGTDLDGRILSWNQGAEKLFGYTPDEAIGKHITLLFRVDRQADHLNTLHKIRRQEQIERLEGVRVRKDGTSIDVSIILSPIKDALGRLQGVSAIYRDITASKRADAELLKAKEAAEAASRAKSTFLATMSHEIRTPMNGILGMTELVLDSDLTPDQRDSLDLVHLSAESLLSVINDILDFSKIEAGKMEFESIPFDLRETLGETMETLGFRAHQKGLELVYDLEPDVPAALLGDPGRLRQVLVNLVGNAIKFTEQGEILVNVGRESESPDAVCLHFSVKDTGVGIPAEKQEKIFEAFSQADGSMTRKYGGTGLGLTICGRLVEIMNGRIWVESQIGQGSTFHFTTRLGVQRVVSEPAAHLHPAQLRDLPVLIVDDNSTNRRVLTEMLTRWGMKPTAVDGGRAALMALEIAKSIGRPFALILLDGHMPEMDGFTLAGEIQNHPELVRTTIMMLTSADHLGAATLCRERGISAYLVKPIRQSELLAMICRGMQVPQEPTEGPRISIAPANTNTQSRVLVAEDNVVNQALARRLLEKRGYAVSVVKDGRAAVEAVKHERFDIVLMDIQMPNMDGFEATAAIRRHEQLTGIRVPIVALTAHALKGDDERCLAAGMDAYISKPIRQEDLYVTIENMLGRIPAQLN
ncbi:MAG: response regulator [Acidobacteriia bacterium]|nr:response regulator [Terriglobia bacterium]